MLDRCSDLGTAPWPYIPCQKGQFQSLQGLPQGAVAGQSQGSAARAAGRAGAAGHRSHPVAKGAAGAEPRPAPRLQLLWVCPCAAASDPLCWSCGRFVGALGPLTHPVLALLRALVACGAAPKCLPALTPGRCQLLVVVFLKKHSPVSPLAPQWLYVSPCVTPSSVPHPECSPRALHSQG